MNTPNQVEKARQLRADIVKSLYHAKSGHPGGSLSCVEILVALYYGAARIDPENPGWEERERIVLSKGHACPALYAVLADKGYFPKEDLWTLRRIDSHLQGHPDMTKTPGVDVNSGSLGQGISVALGMALAAKYKKAPYHVYAIIGDGECQEGMVWEASMAAAHYKLDNFTVILDHNGLQIDGSNDQVMSLGNVMDKFRAFDYDCYQVDGHDVGAITEALNATIDGRPKFICCETVKGKGISFMEGDAGWHGRAPNADEYKKAMLELGVEVDG